MILGVSNIYIRLRHVSMNTWRNYHDGSDGLTGTMCSGGKTALMKLQEHHKAAVGFVFFEKK
jgi:hypothetical protein